MTAFAGLSRPHLSALLRPMPTSVNPLAMKRTSRTLFTQPQRTVSVRRMGQRRIDPTEQGAASGEAKKDSLWQSWLNLDPSTRLAFGITLAGEHAWFLRENVAQLAVLRTQ